MPNRRTPADMALRIASDAAKEEGWGHMKTGTKSVLFGVHCWFIHPWFVAAGWWKLYGFPFDPRLWVAFFVHDLGYFGCENMDDVKGEYHPAFGALIMLRLFGPEWHDLCLYHSRFLAKKYDHAPSRLCYADKLVPSLEPWWFYLPRAWASGELWEYLSRAGGKDGGKYAGEPNSAAVRAHLEGTRWRDWYNGMALFCVEYVAAHKDGRQDTWTKGGAA